jgi:glycosyltransferase involved in cell wall biosynthesis
MNKARRILIIPSWYPPDGGYFFKEHSEALRNSGWEVDVLVNRVVGARKFLQVGTKVFRGFQVKDENGLRVIRSFYLKIPGSEKINIRRWGTGTCKLYQKYHKQFGHPDLILCHSVTWAGYAAALIKESFNIPFLIVEHRSFFVWSTEKARQMVKPYYLPFFEKAYGSCNKLVLVSESLLTGLKTLMPWIDKKAMVIPNMIREDMFLPPEEPRPLEPFGFIWAGRLEHVKGLDLLIRAVQILKEKGLPEFNVRLAGKGSLRSELEDLTTKLDVSDRIQFLGRLSREEMQREMQQAHSFVLPTRYEAFGAVLIEAMAAGLPVIATLSGGPDAIVNETNGILIAPENHELLAAAMEEMIRNYKRFDSKKIRTACMEKYGQTAVMKRFNDLFLQLLEE